MTVLRTSLLVLSALALSACDPAERMCRTEIEGRLIYPDTARFHEFKTVSRQEYVTQATETLTGAAAIPSIDLRILYRQTMHDVVSRSAEKMGAAGATFHTYRIEARDRRGRDVGAVQVCMATKEGCGCLSGEPGLERR